MSKLSRRDFLRGSAVGLGVSGSSLRAGAQQVEFHEAIIIGSGFGGAVAALRLGQAGVETLVLERGNRWKTSPPDNNARDAPIFGQDTFATFDDPNQIPPTARGDRRAGWLSNFTTGLERTLGLPFPFTKPIDVYTGVLELIKGEGMEVRAGAGVGGSTLVYNAILLEPREKLFKKAFPSINFEEMETHYNRVRSIIKPATIPADILAHPLYKSTNVNLQQAMNAGFFKGKLVEYAVDWDVVRQEIAAYNLINHIGPLPSGPFSRPSAIDGQSWYGLNSGAKKSVDKNYLKMAEEKTGHVEIRPLHVVVDIFEDRSVGLFRYRISALKIHEDGSFDPVKDTLTFFCRYLFLAAGSMGTSALLVKAQATGTLPKLKQNQWVGRCWGSNGDIGVVRGGLNTHLVGDKWIPDNGPGEGGPAGHFLAEDLDPDHPEPTDTALVELVTQKNLKSLQLVPPFVPAPGKPGGISVFIGLGLAPPVGYFTYDAEHDLKILQQSTVGPVSGAPDAYGWRPATLHWPSPAAADPRLGPFLSGGQSMLNHLDASNFASPPNGPNGTGSTGNFATTAHPVGGAVLGKVCRGHGQVIDHPGLYVIDAAFIPSGTVGDVNPAFTVAALAERNIEWIITHDIFGHGDEDDQGDDNQQ
jgi:cholesterol oxidase